MATKEEGRTQLGPYMLVRKLGEGGMGSVFLAEDPADGRRVAIKVLPRSASENPEFLKRFEREAEAAAKLRHPCIAAGYAAGEDRGYHYYAMEYCDGEPLDRMLRREKSLSPQRALEILLQVTKGLQYAHAQGVIHRDIKPANIFFTKDGSTKILDLGLAKTMGSSDRSFLTMSGAVVGTPHYISPEQAEGSKTIDGRADIYSLGATFYHLLTGQTPFDGASPVEVMYKHVHGELPDPRDLRDDIPDSYVHLLRKMMAKKPEDRYATCDELFTDLKEIITGGSPKSAPLNPQQSTIAPARKIRAVPKRPSTVRRAMPAASGGGVLLWSGLAIAAVAIVIFLVAKSDGESERAAPAAPKAAAPKTAATPPKAVAVPAPAPSPGAVVPLLPLLDLRPGRDLLKGTWVFENGDLHSDAMPGARVVIPYEPPEEYDLKMEFTPSASADVQVLLSRGGRPFMWAMGAFNNTHFGLGFLRDGKEKTGLLFKTVRQACLTQNWRYRMAVQVRRDRVTASLDGETLVDGSPDLSTLGGSPVFPFPPGSTLGLLCYQGTVRIHQLELVEVTGKGRVLRTADAAPPPAKPEVVAAGPWRRLFDGRTTDCLTPDCRSGWVVRDGAIQNVPGENNAARTREPIGDGDVRIRFEVEHLDSLYFRVRQNEGGYSTALQKPLLASLEGSRHELLFSCRGKTVTATLDGRPVPLPDVAPALRGAIQWNAQGNALRIFALDVRDAGRDLQPWTALFDGKTLDCLQSDARNHWRLENGAIVPIPGRIQACRTAQEVSDGQVRIRFENEGVRLIELHVRQGPDGAYSVVFDRPECAQLEGRPHVVMITFEGDHVEATLDERPVPIKRDGRPRKGAIQIHRQGDGLRILSIDVR